MGRKENPLLAYYNQPERFAQLMNGWLFGGAECWKAEDVRETDRRTGDGRKGTEGKARERYRDLFKKVGGALVRLYIGTELMEYVEDYSIHILDVCHAPDEKLREFPPEIRFLLMCIKYARDKEAFLRLTEQAEAASISEDTFGTIAEYLGEPELLENGEKSEGGRNMCEAIRALVEDGREEGRKEGEERGESKGIEMARQIFKLAGKGEEIPEIARLLSISEDKVRWVLR